MSKIYTDKWICECMGKPCDYYEECQYPLVYCNSHCENGMEVREFIKGMKSSGTVSFKNHCRRDDKIIQTKWNEKMLKEYVAMVKEKFPELECSLDNLKAELQELKIWEELEVQ